MTYREIIESGIIELYVMNALPADEAVQVEAWAAEFPEVRAEIEANQLSLEKYAQEYAIEPRPALKTLILERFEAENAPQNTPNTPLSKKRHFGLSAADWAWVITALTVIGLLVSLFNHRTTRKALSDCTTGGQVLVAKKDSIINDLRQKLNVLRHPATRKVVMTDKGTPNKIESEVIVYWNVEAKTTWLSISKLPQPATGKQYQLWAIVKGKPVDAGVFNYDFDSIQTMKIFDQAEAFAVTLENEGGSASPTLEQMYAIQAL